MFMTGKKVLLSQLCYYERYGLSACSVDPFVEELAENGYKIPSHLLGAFSIYYDDLLMQEGNQDDLCKIISKWYCFFRPIADMVASDLGDSVFLYQRMKGNTLKKYSTCESCHLRRIINF
jgi:hypothetical protein